MMMSSMKWLMKITHAIYILVSLLGLVGFAFELLPNNNHYILEFCSPSEAIKPNSTYESNLKVLMSYLASNATQQNDNGIGFYKTVVGWGTTDSITGQFLCRGDVNLTTCQHCISIAANQTLQLCLNGTDFTILYDLCMLSFTNHSFQFDSLIANGVMWNATKIPNSQQLMRRFNESVWEIFSALAIEAAFSETRFATYEVEYYTTTQNEKLYGLAQCTPDLTTLECTQCFQKAFQEFYGFCNANFSATNECPYEGSAGTRVMLSGCNIRYEMYLFYNVTHASPPTPTFPPAAEERHNGSQRAVVIVVSIMVSVMIFGFGCYLLRRKTRQSNSKAILRENFGEEGSNLKSLRFNLATIEAATSNFSHEKRIGKGGFGEVYKGILPDGQEIAVKRLSKSSTQGVLEFKNEIMLIARLQHRNLVALIGFCLEEKEKILIYEYVPNKSIDCFLFDSDKQKLLNWSQRFKILGGIARGLLYLHEHSRLKVIHRDLKPSNILLDKNMNPKISDFGLARMVAIDEEQGSTNRIVGTLGYMSPEYLMHGQFSEKSDVFSFGIIILEAVSGKRNARSYESSHLLTNAWKLWNDGAAIEVLDPFLMESCFETEVIRCVQIGLLCVQENPDDRPSMAQIVTYLSNHSIELPFPRQPAFFMHSRETPTMVADSGSGQSSQSFKPSSFYEMSNSEFLPR